MQPGQAEQGVDLGRRHPGELAEFAHRRHQRVEFHRFAGFDILQLIPATPDAIGLADLIARTDRSRRTVFRKLAKLKASGIVTTDAAGRLSRTSHDLESLARWLGTANTRDNKRRRYLEQRHAYREAIREMHAKVDPETGELGA